MTESPDLDRRVTRLEQEMIELRQDTSLANTLAREAGLEVSAVHANYRAHTHTLNAIRETQAEHTELHREHSQTLGEHTRILGEHSRTLREHNDMHRGHTRTLNALRETQVDHSGRLDRLEQKVDHGFSVMSVGMAQITALLTNKLNEGEGEE
jgi:hypothetical protein